MSRQWIMEEWGRIEQYRGGKTQEGMPAAQANKDHNFEQESKVVLYRRRPRSHRTGLSLLIWTKYANKCCSKRSPMTKTNEWRRNVSIATVRGGEEMYLDKVNFGWCIWIGSTLGWCCWWIVDRDEDFFIMHALISFRQGWLCHCVILQWDTFLLLGKDCSAHQVNGNMSTKVIPWYEWRRCYRFWHEQFPMSHKTASLHQCRLSQRQRCCICCTSWCHSMIWLLSSLHRLLLPCAASPTAASSLLLLLLEPLQRALMAMQINVVKLPRTTMVMMQMNSKAVQHFTVSLHKCKPWLKLKSMHPTLTYQRPDGQQRLLFVPGLR